MVTTIIALVKVRTAATLTLLAPSERSSMIQTIWDWLNRLLSSPSYPHVVVRESLEQTQATAKEVTKRLDHIAKQRDPYEALLASMLEARNEREMRDRKNGKY